MASQWAKAATLKCLVSGGGLWADVNVVVRIALRVHVLKYPDPWEDLKSRSINGGSYKVPLVV